MLRVRRPTMLAPRLMKFAARRRIGKFNFGIVVLKSLLRAIRIQDSLQRKKRERRVRGHEGTN